MTRIYKVFTSPKVLAKIPVDRLGEPDEIARMVEFLAGQIFSVNGGQYM